MEKFDSEQQPERPDYLPQSESEWLKIGKFEIKTLEINGRKIRCALTRGDKEGQLITMAGGVPRDPDRRKKLPLINKLYGHLALKMLDQGESSLLYNQPATGGSSGEWETETIQSRTDVLVKTSKHFYENTNSSELALIGTSAAGYMAVRAIEPLQACDVKVAKLVLLSPAAYPQEIETMPYGEAFTEIIRKPWKVADSPIFPELENYLRNGGSAYISFFEADDPPIPKHIQEYYQTLVERLSREGIDITLNRIPGVAHNFRRIGAHTGQNIVDNDSVRSTAALLKDFLTKRASG